MNDDSYRTKLITRLYEARKSPNDPIAAYFRLWKAIKETPFYRVNRYRMCLPYPRDAIRYGGQQITTTTTTTTDASFTFCWSFNPYYVYWDKDIIRSPGTRDEQIYCTFEWMANETAYRLIVQGIPTSSAYRYVRVTLGDGVVGTEPIMAAATAAPAFLVDLKDYARFFHYSEVEAVVRVTLIRDDDDEALAAAASPHPKEWLFGHKVLAERWTEQLIQNRFVWPLQYEKELALQEVKRKAIWRQAVRVSATHKIYYLGMKMYSKNDIAKAEKKYTSHMNKITSLHYYRLVFNDACRMDPAKSWKWLTVDEHKSQSFISSFWALGALPTIREFGTSHCIANNTMVQVWYKPKTYDMLKREYETLKAAAAAAASASP